MTSNYQNNDEASTRRAIKNNWGVFFPRLKLISDNFIIDKHSKYGKKIIDILAFDTYKKRFVIIELKKGKDSKQLSQSIDYRDSFQNNLSDIYFKVELEHDDIVLPKLDQLNESQIILISESYPLNYNEQIKKVPNLILINYFWVHIDLNSENLLLNYFHNKPPKEKQQTSCIITKSSIQRSSKLVSSKIKINLIKIIFPDGSCIMEKTAFDTFLNTMRRIGIEEIRNSKIHLGNLFIDNLKEVELEKRKYYKKIEGAYLYKHNSTARKVRILETISKAFKVNYKIQILEKPPSIDSWKRQEFKRKRTRLINKIINLTELEIIEFSAKEKEIIIRTFS